MADVNEPKLWVVKTSAQEVNLVCRIFAREEDAQAYAATAREWLARHGNMYPSEKPDSRWPEGIYRHWLNHTTGHRADLVDEAKAASETWPFGDDHRSEFFTVTAYPFVPEPNPQNILDAILAHGDHLPNLAICTARGDFNPLPPRPAAKFKLGQYVGWRHTYAPDEKTITIDQGGGIIKESRYNGKAWSYLIHDSWVHEQLITTS